MFKITFYLELQEVISYSYLWVWLHDLNIKSSFITSIYLQYKQRQIIYIYIHITVNMAHRVNFSNLIYGSTVCQTLNALR